MSRLDFSVLDVVPERYAAAPHLLFRVRATEASGEVVHAVALRCQLRIEPQRRRYSAAEKEVLAELFGAPERWASTLKPFLWAHTTAVVRGFSGSVEFDLPLPCTYDFEVTAAKYLHALSDGEIPLVLLFSGTLFARGATGFTVEQLPWDLEASHRMPVRVWRDLMDTYFPNGGWIRLDRETLDALIRFKSARALPTWERALGALLASSGALDMPEPVR
ncbi:MAG: DUF6084 family protein [Kineosporiaceae bacterium]